MWKGQEIEIHFKEITNLADRISNLSERLKVVACEQIRTVLRDTKNAWNSECADLLIGKEARLSEGLMDEAEKLKETAVRMKEQAEKMYQTEMANDLLGKVRIYL